MPESDDHKNISFGHRLPSIYSDWNHLFLITNQFHFLSQSMSPSNTIPFPSPFPHSYPIHLDDDARLARLVSIVTVIDARAVL